MKRFVVSLVVLAAVVTFPVASYAYSDCSGRYVTKVYANADVGTVTIVLSDTLGGSVANSVYFSSASPGFNAVVTLATSALLSGKKLDIRVSESSLCTAENVRAMGVWLVY